MSTNRSPRAIDLQTAAEVVALPAPAVEALASAGYLAATDGTGGAVFELADLKAFVARNADNGAGGSLQPSASNRSHRRSAPGGPLQRSLTPDLDPQELVDLLDERAEHMASRLLKMYATVFPQAQSWPAAMQKKFVQKTKDRFEAILAIAALGDRFQPEFVEDLQAIGASAARSGVGLPQILTMLRVSRDLVVQNAIDLAENGERHGGHALSLLLTRILPAMDRIGDALTAGYWEAMFPA